MVVCLKCYMNDMINGSGQLPVGIAGREDIIFGNIVEIHEFHKKLVDFCLIYTNDRDLKCVLYSLGTLSIFALSSGSQVA